MVLVYMILGLIVVGVMLPVIKYIKDSGNTNILEQYDINPDDDFVPFDYESFYSEDDKIALTSMQVLVAAINNLSNNEEVGVEGKKIDKDKTLEITFYATFEQDIKYAPNTRFQAPCTIKGITRYDKDYSVNCKDEFDKTSRYKRRTPYDIDDVHNFEVRIGGKTCPKIENSSKYAGQDLETWNKKTEDHCNESPSYVICEGYKIYYCGKSAWTLKAYVEKTDKEEQNIAHFQSDYLSIITDMASSAVDSLKRVFGVSPDKVSSAYCYAGKEIKVLNSNVTLCLKCDNNIGDGKCSLEGFELPQEVNKDTAKEWIGGYGDPDYIAYLEMFPQGEEESWQISPVSILSVSFMVGAGLEVLPLVGKIKPIVNIWSKIKFASKSTIKSIFKQMDNALPSLSKRTSNEIAKTAIEIGQPNLNLALAGRVGASEVYIRNTVKMSLDNLPTASMFIDDAASLSDDVAVVVRKYINEETGELSQEGIQRISDDVYVMFKDKADKTLADPAVIDKAGLELKTQVDDIIKNTDFKKAIDDIIAISKMTQDQKSFRANIMGLFEKSSQSKKLYVLKKDVLDSSIGKMDEILENLPNDVKEKLFKKSSENYVDFLNPVTGKINWKKIFGSSNIDDGVINDLTKQLDDAFIFNPKYKDLLSNRFITGTELGADISTFSSEALIKYKKRIAAGFLIGVYSQRMDALNEKYSPAGYGEIALSKVSSYEPRRLFSLSEAAKELFIRLDKEDRDDKFTNRLHLVSPCKTDLDIRKERCLCAVENSVKNVNGQWTGYLLESGQPGEKSYIPVLNTGDKIIPEEKSFTLTDTRTAANKFIQIAIPGSPGIVNTIGASRTVKYPIIYQAPEFAVKECQTRSWFDQQISAFNNLDVETDCINIAEADNVGSKYSGYNDGYNYCYAGENVGAELLKLGIIAAQIGVSTALGPTGVGILAAGGINILLNYGVLTIDDYSKWPNKDLNMQQT